MEHKYSIERNVQIIVALMKAHGIKRVIASPGSTNVCLSHSLQNDPYFEMYSSVDERSAAYLACGLAAETGEPVALTCTEATASRNYLSGLTEAYYRHLPILCITATNDITLVGQHHAQMIDRSSIPNDIVYKSLFVPIINSDSKAIGYSNLINDAMLELFRRGGSPVHIEYETSYSTDFSVETLPSVNVTRRITIDDEIPELKSGKIAIYVGAHKRWSEKLVKAVDSFCEHYNAVVLCDHIANYNGKYGVYYTLISSQAGKNFDCEQIDTCIYIGDVSSAYPKNLHIKDVWRVNPDGELRDVLRKYGGKQKYVFEMEEHTFFEKYNQLIRESKNCTYAQDWQNTLQSIMQQIPELPFSNLWIAQQTVSRIPKGSRLFLGIENTLRTWNFFESDSSVEGYSNTGGFGIDGGVSSMIGASFADTNKLYFGVTGDLAFFYDMNVLGNRHVGNNIRLMVINNAVGQQFKNHTHFASKFGDVANDFIAAAGHYGNKSASLLHHYAEDLGFEYMSASNKDEYHSVIERFCTPDITDKPMLLEIFTDTIDETEALRIISSLEITSANQMKDLLKGTVKSVLGESGIKTIKNLLKK